jgi:hypothetical protein
MLSSLLQRFPDTAAGARIEINSSAENVYIVTWADIGAAKWPKHPKLARNASMLPKSRIDENEQNLTFCCNISNSLYTRTVLYM